MSKSMLSAVAVATAAGLITNVATAQDKGSVGGLTEYEKQLIQIIEKDPDSLDARRAWTQLYYYTNNRSVPGSHNDRVVYGNDDRKEVWEYDTLDPTLRAMSEAAAVVVNRSELTDNGDGTYTLITTPYNDGSLCADEPFIDQPNIGNCSAWFVGDDIIVTAGHCIDAGDVGTWGYLFNFEIDVENGDAPVIVPAEDVYWITEIIDRELGGGYDHTVSRVDRPVTGRAPVRIARDTPPAIDTPLTVIGHPSALPKKIAGGAWVQAVDGPDTFLESNLDTYGGNSGSMVIRTDTYEVVGILVRGAPDFRTRTGEGCTESNQLADTGSGFAEDVSLTMRFQDFIPEVGISVTPAGDTTHIGAVGGPFTNDTVLYTLDNPTSDPIDYTINVDDFDGILLFDGSATPPAGGTLAGNASTSFTVTLDPSVSSLPAGTYPATITVNDTTNNVSNARVHQAEIGQTLVSVSPTNALISGGPVGGPFNATTNHTIQNLRPTPVDVQVVASDPWIDVTVGPGGSNIASLSGQGAFGDSVGVIVGFSADANNLAAGLYTGTVDFINLDNNDTTTIDVALDVGRFLYAPDDTPAAINDNATITSSVFVPDAYCVGDVQVELDITHTFIGDLRVTLTSPTGVEVTLHDRTGSSADDIVTTYSSANPADGPGSLDDFTGLPVGGLWTLTVSDNAGGDTGTLNSWALRPQSAGVDCPPIANDVSINAVPNRFLDVTLDSTPGAGGQVDYIVTTLPSTGQLWDGMTAITNVPFNVTPGNDTLGYRANRDFAGDVTFQFRAIENGNESNDATAAISIGTDGVLFEETLDTDPSWTAEGDWAFGQPAGNDGDPTSGATGDNVYGFNLNGDYSSNLPATYLTTDAIDASTFSGTTLRFQRWLGVEHSGWDQATIEVSSDGSNWTEIWRNPAGFGNTIDEDAWGEVEYDVSAVADGAATFYIRWGLGPTDGSVQFQGWNIDDVQLIGLVPAGCIADVSGPPQLGNPDGVVDPSDLTYFLDAYVADDPIADFTGPDQLGIPDGVVDPSDLTLFLDLYVSQCN